MTDKCKTCGRTPSQAIADARTLGVQQEFDSGIYTCCQIAQWAHDHPHASNNGIPIWWEVIFWAAL